MEYFLYTDRQLGPFTLEQLSTLAELTPDTNVWKEGMADWAPAHTLPELQQILAERFPAGNNLSAIEDPDVMVIQSPDEPPTDIISGQNNGYQYPAQQAQEPSYAPQQVQPMQQNYAQPQFENNTSEPKKSHKGLWALLIIVGVLVAASVAMYFTNPSREDHIRTVKDAISVYAENSEALGDYDDKTREEIVKEAVKKIKYNDYFIFSTTSFDKTTASWGLFTSVIDRTGDISDKALDKALEKAATKVTSKKK